MKAFIEETVNESLADDQRVKGTEGAGGRALSKAC